MTKRKLTLEETMKAAVEMGDQDEALSKMLAKSDEEIKKELSDAGFDLDAVHAELEAKQKAIRDDASPAAAPKANVRDIRTARKAVKWSTTTLLFAAGLSFASAAGTVLALGKTDNLPVAFKPSWTIPSGGVTSGGVPEPLKASDIRDNAYREFFQHRYADCLHDLDTAKSLDPQGDAAEAVQNARAEATARMKQPRSP
jgi:hypothetical protein